MNITRSHVYSSLVVAGLCFAALAGSGCATRSEFAVSALRDHDVELHGASYRLVPGPALLAHAGTPLPDQVLQDVRTALSSHGSFEAPGGTAPGLMIEVEFEQSPPLQRAERVSEPVYVTGASGASDAARGEARGSTQPRKIGDRDVVYWVTTYPKTLRLSAWQAGGSDRAESAAQVWQVVVSHEGDTASPERDARWMVAAAMDWLGKSAEQRQTVVLTAGDQRLRFLERGLANRTLAVANRANRDAPNADSRSKNARIASETSPVREPHET